LNVTYHHFADFYVWICYTDSSFFHRKYSMKMKSPCNYHDFILLFIQLTIFFLSIFLVYFIKLIHYSFDL
jgi:hypothetical protein